MNKSQLTADLIKRTAKKQGLSISKLLIDYELNKNAIYCSLTRKIQKMQNRGKCRKKYKNAIKTA